MTLTEEPQVSTATAEPHTGAAVAPTTMLLKYVQKTGRLYANGKLIGLCYSGCGEGFNNHALESTHDVGPIPCGEYTVTSINEPHLGPIVFELLPIGFEAYGRSGFRIHWDNEAQNFTASTGCIVVVMPIAFRRIVAPARLSVVADE